MKLISLLTLTLCLSFFSCSKSNNSADIKADNKNDIKKEATPQQTEKKPYEEPVPEVNDLSERNLNTNNADGIRVNFPAGATHVSMNGKISGFGQNITYLFEVKAGQNLTASVKPQSGKGNIRISQIISPSGNADGPFGIQMTYPLTESGDWKLILSENQMSGDPWAGEYVLTVEIK